MNPIPLLTENVSNLWYWTYGIIAGWGATLTFIIVVMVVLLIRLLHCERRIQTLESRIVAAERDFNLATNKWQTMKKDHKL